jgi:putative Mg2+ transporter-C (MgtC) family protein
MMQIQILGYVILAMLLGGIIGAEREMADKPAGLRTHMLVAGSAALLVGLGDVLITHFSVDPELVRTDPIRIIEAVITGISFLGAGTIIRSNTGNHIEGLTTAASLLFVAALGICVALSQFILAIGATALAFLTVYALRSVKIWLDKK